jgi:hypothetical protein
MSLHLLNTQKPRHSLSLVAQRRREPRENIYFDFSLFFSLALTSK